MILPIDELVTGKHSAPSLASAMLLLKLIEADKAANNISLKIRLKNKTLTIRTEGNFHNILRDVYQKFIFHLTLFSKIKGTFTLTSRNFTFRLIPKYTY